LTPVRLELDLLSLWRLRPWLLMGLLLSLIEINQLKSSMAAKSNRGNGRFHHFFPTTGYRFALTTARKAGQLELFYKLVNFSRTK
jgi:hypothetical protein